MSERFGATKSEQINGNTKGTDNPSIIIPLRLYNCSYECPRVKEMHVRAGAVGVRAEIQEPQFGEVSQQENGSFQLYANTCAFPAYNPLRNPNNDGRCHLLIEDPLPVDTSGSDLA